MAKIQSRHYLGEDSPDDLLLDEFFVADASLDDLLEVTLFAVLHYDVQLEILLVDATIVIANDVWVLQIAQDVDFRNNLLFFLVAHLAVVEFFLNEHTAVGHSAHLADTAKTSCDKKCKDLNLAPSEKWRNIFAYCTGRWCPPTKREIKIKECLPLPMSSNF